MTDSIRLTEDQWIVKRPIGGANFYCISLVFMRDDHISHCACGIFSDNKEEAIEVAKEQTVDQFPREDGWNLIGVASSRVIFTSSPANIAMDRA